MARRVGGINYENQTAECLLCGEWKPWAAFVARRNKKRSSKPIQSRCDECNKNRVALSRARKRELLGIPPAPPSNENIELREATCTNCKTTKPFSEFQTNHRQHSARITESWCRQCRSMQRKQWRLKNPEKEAAARRKRRADPKGKAARMMTETRKRARNETHVPYDLELEWFQKRIDAGCCEVTGVPFDLRNPDEGSRYHTRPPFAPSCDQLIPSAGYTRENARLVSAIFNQAKHIWTDEDVVSMSYALLKNRGFTVIPPEHWKPSYEKEPDASMATS